jgi:hypothetical protein
MQSLLYLLPVLICPIAMGLMMWFMMRGMQGTQGHGMQGMGHVMPAQPPMSSLRQDGEILTATRPNMRRDLLPAPSDAHQVGADGPTREERLTDLHARLAALEEYQQTLEREIAELDSALRPEHVQQSYQM